MNNTPPLPLPEDEWKLKVNANYQEAMKTLISLVTASLVLPIFFIRNFLGISDPVPIRPHLHASAYWAWVFLFASLLCSMFFYLGAAKFVKVVCGGKEEWPKRLFRIDPEKFFEHLRDGAVGGTVLFFVAAIVALGRFFTQS